MSAPTVPSPAGAWGGVGREDDGHHVFSEGPMRPTTTLSPGDGGEGHVIS